MSRNYEILRQLEETSQGSHDASSVPKTEDWSQISARPRTDGPFYAPRPGVREVPLHQAEPPKHGATVDEEIGRLVESLALSQNGRELRTIVFCGIEDNGVSSFACANAGRGLAARSESVCLVDTNLRERSLSRYLEIGSQSSSRNGPMVVKDRCIQLERNLWFAGPELITGESGALLPVDGIASVLGRLQTSFHYILIDAQGTSTSRDAALFGNLADGAVLVIEADKTRKDAARKAKELFEAAGVPLIGTILNNRSFPIPEAIYKRI